MSAYSNLTLWKNLLQPKWNVVIKIYDTIIKIKGRKNKKQI